VAPAGRELVGTVLEAFTRHRLVGIGNHTACRTITTRCDCRSPTRGCPRRSTTSSSSSATRATRTRWTGSSPGDRSPTPTFAWCGGTPCSQPADLGRASLLSSWRETQAARGIAAPQPARAKDLPQSARRTRMTGLPPGNARVPAGERFPTRARRDGGSVGTGPSERFLSTTVRTRRSPPSPQAPGLAGQRR
jgi:hypothetical protein